MKLAGILALLPVFLQFIPNSECRLYEYYQYLARFRVPCDVASRGTSFLQDLLDAVPEDVRPVGPLRLEHLTGVDLTDPVEMKRVVCRVIEATSLQELKRILDDLDVTFHMARFTYDLLAGELLIARDLLPGVTAIGFQHELQLTVLQLVETIYRTGFLGLDPEGIHKIAGLITDEAIPQPPPPEVIQSCDHVMAPLDATLDLLVYSSPYPGQGEHMRMIVESWTGLDLDDREALHNFTCNILESRDLRQMYDVLESFGVMDAALATGYDEAVRTAYNYRRGLQYAVDELERLETVADLEWYAYESGWENADLFLESLQRQAATADVYFPLLESLEQSGFMNLTGRAE